MSGLSVHCTNDSDVTAVLYLRDRIDPSALASFPHLTPAVVALTPAARPGAAGSGEGQFACEVLPVAVLWWKDISPRRLLVSQEAYRDHAPMDRLLKERIVPLLD